MGSLTEQVDDAPEVGTLSDGDLDGHDLLRKPRLDILVHTLEGGVVLVHHGDKKEPGDSPVFRVLPDGFSAYLHAGGGAHYNNRGVRHPDRRQRLTDEVHEARSVEQVDLGARVLAEGRRALKRDPVARLLRRVHCECSSFADVALPSRGTSGVTERVDKAGLPSPAVAQNNNIPDLIRRILCGERHVYLLPDVRGLTFLSKGR